MAGRITSLCGEDSVQIKPEDEGLRINLVDLSRKFDRKNIKRCNDYLLQVRIGDYEMSLFSNGRAIIKGIKSADEAVALYSRYVPGFENESGE